MLKELQTYPHKHFIQIVMHAEMTEKNLLHGPKNLRSSLPYFRKLNELEVLSMYVCHMAQSPFKIRISDPTIEIEFNSLRQIFVLY